MQKTDRPASTSAVQRYSRATWSQTKSNQPHTDAEPIDLKMPSGTRKPAWKLSLMRMPEAIRAEPCRNLQRDAVCESHIK
jgi:hypothetical protein